MLAVLLGLLAACAPAVRPGSSADILDNTVAIRTARFEFSPAQTRLSTFNPLAEGASVTLQVGAVISNPNDVAIRLQTVDYTLFGSFVKIAEGVLEPSLLLAPGEHQTFSFQVPINLEDNPELLRQVAETFAGKPLPLRLEGAMTLEVLGRELHFNRRVLLVGEMTRSDRLIPPQLSLDEVESDVFFLRPDFPVVRVVLRAYNPGDVGYFLYGNEVTLKVAGVPLAVADISPVPIPARAAGRVEVLFYPDYGQPSPEVRAALSAAARDIPMSFALEGDLRLDVLGVGTFDVPAGWELYGFLSSGGP